MIDEIKKEARDKMQKSIDSLSIVFGRIRTGRANPSLLDNIRVPYYGSQTQLSQVANVTAEDARTLSIRAWERSIIPEIEKAILKSGLGLNPSTAGEVIRIPLPALTEETRKGFVRQAKQDAETARQAIRHSRRESLLHIKELEKAKDISEDAMHQANEEVQKITDLFIDNVDKLLANKEADLMKG